MSVQRIKRVDMNKLVNDAAGMVIEDALAFVEERAVALAPAVTGNLRNSIGNRKTGPTSGEVYSNAEYAVYVEFGSASFFLGKSVYIKGVGWRYIGQHPGTPEQPYMRPALDEYKARANKDWGQAVRKSYASNKR